MATDGPPAWVADAVFYQVFPDRFARSDRVVAPGPLEDWNAPPTRHGFKGGDLRGVAEHLDHLTELGINAIYLNPIFSSASNHRYHTFDYMTVDPLLGGDDAFRELLDAAHGRGMRIILDGVFNHASRGFWPFHHVMETGRHSPYRDWFYFNTDALDAGRQLRAYPDESLRDALETEWGEAHAAGLESLETLGYRAWWDLPALPKLNTDNPVVREYIFGVAEHWIRFGADGWRLDVAGEIEDPEFWREFRRRVHAVNRDAYIVAEIWREHPEVLQGDRFDTLMNYPLAEAIVSFIGGDRLDMRVVGQHSELARNIRPEDATTFARRLDRALTVYRRETTHAMLNVLDSHDTPRLITMAGGDRTTVLLSWLLVMTLPGAPCVYYGDEIGLPGEMDPDCRRAFPWDRGAWDEELLAWFRSVIALRHAEPALRHGNTRVLAAHGMSVAFERSDEFTRFVVALNAGDTAATLELAGVERASRLEPVPLPLVPATAPPRAEASAARIDLPPRTGVVYRVA